MRATAGDDNWDDGSAAPRRGRGRALGGVLVVLLTTLASLLILAGPASAGSTSCVMYGDGIKYGVRNGQFCSTVHGSGTWVSSVTGSFGTTIPYRNQICAPSMKVDFYDNYGNWKGWRQGPRAGGCYPHTWNTPPAIPVNTWVPAGRARITLQEGGRTVQESWHGIR